MNLYFIRHAEPDYEHDTITEEGKVQAEKLAQWFSDIKIDELYHSSMGRACATASFIAKKCGIEAKSIDWARELCWGRIQGDALDSMSPWAIKDRYIESEKKYPEGNEWRTIPELKGNRLVPDVDEHCAALDMFLAERGYAREGKLYKVLEPNSSNVVIVCHGGVISALSSHLANIPFFQYISHMGSDLTAVSKFNFRGHAGEVHPVQIIYMNSQSHLGVK